MTRPISYRNIIAVADLPALLLATALSRLAGRMLSLAIVLYALARFASPALAGWLTFAAIGPGLIISPLAGALLDRIGPVLAVTVDMAISATLIVALIAADQLGWATPPILFVLMAAFSLTSPLSAAGVRTLLPRLVPPEAFDRVNALDTAIYAMVDVLGPAFAGLLVAAAGASLTLIVVALIYGAAAICIARIRRLPGLSPSSGSLLRQTIEGLAVVVRQPTLRGLAVSYALYQVTWGILVIVVPVFAARHFAAGAGNAVAGLLWAALGIAGGVGALLTGHFRTVERERPVMAIGMIVTALAAWPVAAEFGLGGLVFGLLLAGLATGPIDVALLTLRQRRTEPGQLGRVLSVSISLNMAGFPLGSAVAGMLITQSLSATFVLAGVASAAGAIAVLAVPAGRRPGMV